MVHRVEVIFEHASILQRILQKLKLLMILNNYLMINNHSVLLTSESAVSHFFVFEETNKITARP